MGLSVLTLEHHVTLEGQADLHAKQWYGRLDQVQGRDDLEDRKFEPRCQAFSEDYERYRFREQVRKYAFWRVTMDDWREFAHGRFIRSIELDRGDVGLYSRHRKCHS